MVENEINHEIEKKNFFWPITKASKDIVEAINNANEDNQKTLVLMKQSRILPSFVEIQPKMTFKS